MNDTSRAAFDSIDARGLRAIVFECIRAATEGRTCDEVETITHMRHQTASARMRELEKAGVIYKSEKRRPTRSGRSAVVYQTA